ncbi:MAG: hypothetical protein J6K78_04775 [Tidjanibacter sp.]|nr:hypothetical protein [Tidjanibacter sp.]
MKRLFLLAAAALATICGVQAQETEVNQYGQKVTSIPVNASVQDGILVFQNKEANYKMWFDVRIQGDAAVFFGYDKELNPGYSPANGMSLRRTRFAVKTQIDENWYGEFDTDWTSGVPEIKDAILQYDGIENLQIKMGNFKENFSIQRNTTSRHLQFMERPMVTSLAPSRHLGINFRYDSPLIWASAGVFGPELKDAEAQTLMEDANKDKSMNEGLSYTGKVVFRPLHKMDNGSLHIGAAISYREPKTTGGDLEDALWGFARYSTRNGTNINRKKYLDTNNIHGLDHEVAWTVELAGHYEGLRYEAAYIARTAHQDETFGNNALTADGWYVQAGYMLFGGKQNYDAGGAKYTRVKRGQKWGDVEACARVEYCDFNMSDAYMGGSAWAYTLGLNFFPIENVKLMINYQFNDQDEYATAKGKANTGYDANNKPTKNARRIAENSKSRGVDYHMLACRFQVAF